MINTILFSVNDKHLIEVPGKYSARVFLKEFLNKKWSLEGLNHLLEKKLTNLVVLNALPIMVDHSQCIMLKTSSLCTVKKTAHTAIVLSAR